MMKVVAINTIPRMEKGNTTLILDPFLEGMKEAGAEVELFYTSNLDVKPCLGCFGCWVKTPGRCVQRDDMDWLLPKMNEANLWVFATPLYVDGVTSPLKCLMDRMLPRVQPFFEIRKGRCRHPLREGAKAGKLVLVSNCGFWEMDNFDPLLVHMRALCENASLDFAGALLRPHGEALQKMAEQGAPAVGEVFQAARKAGREIVEKGSIEEETLRTVGQELMPKEAYSQTANTYFQESLEALEK
jgi:multimeric flavodoxin WrbA